MKLKHSTDYLLELYLFGNVESKCCYKMYCNSYLYYLSKLINETRMISNYILSNYTFFNLYKHFKSYLIKLCTLKRLLFKTLK